MRKIPIPPQDLVKPQCLLLMWQDARKRSMECVHMHIILRFLTKQNLEQIKLDIGCWTLDPGPWTLDQRPWTQDPGTTTWGPDPETRARGPGPPYSHFVLNLRFSRQRQYS